MAKKILQNKPLLQKVRAILKHFPQIEAAYVYGSALKRKDFEDIDIALLLSEKSRRKWERIAEDIRGAIERFFKKECDIHILQEMLIL